MHQLAPRSLLWLLQKATCQFVSQATAISNHITSMPAEGMGGRGGHDRAGRRKNGWKLEWIEARMGVISEAGVLPISYPLFWPRSTCLGPPDLCQLKWVNPFGQLRLTPGQGNESMKVTLPKYCQLPFAVTLNWLARVVLSSLRPHWEMSWANASGCPLVSLHFLHLFHKMYSWKKAIIAQ